MNPLRFHVEGIVRPLHAAGWRKRRMQSELLAHLQAALAEERGGGADEQIAPAQAQRRLGEGAELTRSLQATVPRIEQLFFTWFDRKESFMPRGLRPVGFAIALAGFVWMFGLAILMPALAKLVKSPHDPETDPLVRGCVIGLLLYSIAITLCGVGFMVWGGWRDRRIAKSN
jgi:hypothetical protein